MITPMRGSPGVPGAVRVSARPTAPLAPVLRGHRQYLLFAPLSFRRGLAGGRLRGGGYRRGLALGVAGLLLRGHVFGDQLGLKTADGVGVGKNGLRVVLRLVAGAARLPGLDESAFARRRPVGGAFATHSTVGHKAFGEI